MGLAIAGRPDSVGGAPQAGQLLDLVPPQAGVKHGRDGGQQILDGLLHPADVGLRHGIAVRLEAACQLGLGQGFAGFLFIQFPGFPHAQCALDERQAAVQFVFREMARQGNDFSTLRPRPELARDAEEALVPHLAPQFAQDRETGIAAVADDVVIRARTPGDGRGSVESAFANRRLDVVVKRVAGEARIKLIRSQLIERHDHRRILNRIAQAVRDGAAAREAIAQELVCNVLGGDVRHGHLLPA